MNKIICGDALDVFGGNMKLMSLFDGSGGFPLAASLCGIEPVYASEVEPYPIAVTKSRFPNMKHLGDVSMVNGADIVPVDIITFGSPCQDMSVAGKRAGLKHTAAGDGETTRSGLFIEAIRIIKEMRLATNGIYPRFAVWENVPGAFSSNRGEDFRLVLEEFIRISEPNAVMPAVPQAGWAYADCISGDGWSVAYRTFDAQYWGVPQRRRRIYLVADFRGQRAGEILFKREGLRGHTAQSGTQGQEIAGDIGNGIKADDRAVGVDGYNQELTGNKVQTIRAGKADGDHVGIVIEKIILDDQDGQQINVRSDGKSPTLRAEAHGNVPCVIQSAGFCPEQSAKTRGIVYEENISPTLRAGATPGVVIVFDARGNGDGGTCPTITGDHNNRVTDYTALCCEGKPIVLDYIVRRLTPTECARLQGFLDEWGHPDKKEDFTEEEYKFWLEVRNTYAKINGKSEKEYTKAQMLTWYRKLHTDSAEYKMWGNGIALPNALYVMQGIVTDVDNR